MKRHNKSLFVILLAICIGVSCVGCNGSEPKDSTTTTTTEATTTNEIATSTAEETTTTEATAATSFVENIGEIYVSDVKYLSEKDYTAISAIARSGGWIKLGIDNPNTLEQARKYFENDTLTLEDVGFFQCDMLSGEVLPFDDFVYGNVSFVDTLEFDVIRYLLALNGDRYYISQIGYDFISRYFPDYVELYNESKDKRFNSADPMQEMYDEYWEMISKLREGDTALSNFLTKNISDPEAHETVKLLLFFYITQYNLNWFSNATYYSRTINFMPIAKTTDGKYIVAPSKTPLNQLQKYIKLLPKCENLDITKPETYEDLINSGVNVDLIEKAFDYAGIDIPKLSRSNDQSSDQQ